MKKFLIATLAAALLASSFVVPASATAACVVGCGPKAPGATMGGTNAWPFWAVFGCASSIIGSAMVANFRDHRELTAQEAWTCGTLYWVH